jgi:hypothetical protein
MSGILVHSGAGKEWVRVRAVLRKPPRRTTEDIL